KGYVGGIYCRPWGIKTEEIAKLPGYRQPKDADIAEAKRLLAEAGYPQGFKTTLLCQVAGPREAQAVVFRDQMAKIGIEVELELTEYATVLDRSVRSAFEMVSINWTDNTGDPDETLNTYYVTGGSRNYGRFSSKEFDDLVKKQGSTMDLEARKATLAEIEKMALDLVPMHITFWDSMEIGAWNEVKDYNPGPGYHPWGKYDYMWLAK
ncbi:MAG: ABC transporter substrate-binding protein, partial [Chloroflexota bacterium]